jgi:N-acetylglucosamine transport system permease protein
VLRASEVPALERRRLRARLGPWAAGARLLVYAVLGGWALAVVFPLVWLVYTSFKTDQEIFFSPWALPASLQFDNFARAWVKSGVGRYFLNSLLVVIPSLFFTLLFASMASYVLARFSFPGHRGLFFYFIAGLMFPVILSLVPLFFVVQQLGALNTYQGLIAVYVAYSMPFSIFFLTGFFRTLPSQLAEAALIDGASQFQVFFRVMLPLAQPGLLTIGIFNLLGQWNQFILPLVLMTDNTRYVLTQGLAFMLHEQYYRNDWSAMFAALTVVMIPTVLVYAIFQGQIQRGLTVGALKG